MNTDQTLVQIEAIFSYDIGMPGLDLESGQAVLGSQSIAHFSVPAVAGELSEAAVLFALLGQLSAHERQQLSKVSLCLALSEEDSRRMAPWLAHQDSPLCAGKLWLKQHINHFEAANV